MERFGGRFSKFFQTQMIGFGTKLSLPDGTPLRIIHYDAVNEISGSVPIMVHYLETCSRIEKGTLSKQDGLEIKLEDWQDWLPVKVLKSYSVQAVIDFVFRRNAK